MKLLSRSFVAMSMRFGCVGGVGFICNYMALSVGKTFASPIFAEIIAILVALQVTFFLHDKWTYTIDRAKMQLHKRYLQYLLSNLAGAAITVFVFGLLAQQYPHLVALAAGAVVGLCWNFVFNTFLIWRIKVILGHQKFASETPKTASGAGPEETV